MVDDGSNRDTLLNDCSLSLYVIIAERQINFSCEFLKKVTPIVSTCFFLGRKVGEPIIISKSHFNNKYHRAILI